MCTIIYISIYKNIYLNILLNFSLFNRLKIQIWLGLEPLLGRDEAGREAEAGDQRHDVPHPGQGGVIPGGGR